MVFFLIFFYFFIHFQRKKYQKRCLKGFLSINQCFTAKWTCHLQSTGCIYAFLFFLYPFLYFFLFCCWLILKRNNNNNSVYYFLILTQMDETNRKLWTELHLPFYLCNVCKFNVANIFLYFMMKYLHCLMGLFSLLLKNISSLFVNWEI